MRIALDATYSVGRNLSGVGVYSQQILTGIPAEHPDSDFLFCYRPHRFLRGLRTHIPDNAARTLLWKKWPAAVDLFHGLNQRVDRRYRRVVTTFHDLFVLTGEYSTPEFRTRFAEQARTAAQRSDLIIAVSNFTADQVESLLGIPRARIRVVHHGVAQGSRKSLLSSRTILFVGAIQKRKNVVGLVRAFEQTTPGWKLILVGSAGYEAEEVFLVVKDSPRCADIKVSGYVTPAALEELYQTASIFAFPSFDEGFGMPVLEAMSHGLPVLTSNNSALAEVAGTAALLVDPRDTKAIARGLMDLMQNQELRVDLQTRGLARSSQFTWKRTAEKTWGVYRELLD